MIICCDIDIALRISAAYPEKVLSFGRVRFMESEVHFSFRHHLCGSSAVRATHRLHSLLFLGILSEIVRVDSFFVIHNYCTPCVTQGSPFFRVIRIDDLLRMSFFSHPIIVAILYQHLKLVCKAHRVILTPSGGDFEKNSQIYAVNRPIEGLFCLLAHRIRDINP